MINVKEFPSIIAKMKAAAGNDKEYAKLDQELCGPATGIYYDEDKDEIVIAEDWTVDEKGNVVPCSNYGPGVE